MQRRFLLVLTMLAVGSIQTASGADAFFPLMAWNWAPSDAATFQKMRACGLTVAGFVSPKELDLCHAAGLKAIVSDGRVSGYDWRNVDAAAARKNITELVAETGQHPAVYGYYLRDEPGADAFAGLATVAGIVRELAPGRWPYINLFPNYANAQQLGTATYEEHLEKFVATCQPTQLSYDHYALMDDGSLRAGYFLNLEQMRRTAKQHTLPFWNIVLTVAHFNYREVTPADLRFQVFTTLAYGGRGIAYFTYFAPQVGNYRMAPIDQFGNPTPTWSALQNVNLQVGKLAPVLLQLTSDDVYHFGAIPEGAHGPKESSLVTAVGNAPFLVGDFTHADGSHYALVVNKDFLKSHYCAVTFRQAPRRVQMVSPYTGQLTEFAGEQQWLAAGQGVLLKVN